MAKKISSIKKKKGLVHTHLYVKLVKNRLFHLVLPMCIKLHQKIMHKKNLRRFLKIVNLV
jgi:hypothetical protein